MKKNILLNLAQLCLNSTHSWLLNLLVREFRGLIDERAALYKKPQYANFRNIDQRKTDQAMGFNFSSANNAPY